MLMVQLSQGRSEVENQYSRVVPWNGDMAALKAIGGTMELQPCFEWRGLGFISHSALKVREPYAAMDAELLFQVPARAGRRPEGLSSAVRCSRAC